MTEIKQIVRIIDADIVGNKQLANALTQVTGIGYSFSYAICNKLNLDKRRKVGTLSPEEIKKIQDVIKNPQTYGLPSCLFNRQRDIETGKDLHLTSADLKLSREFDVKRLKRIKTYRGIRHGLGLPVRGQRTRSNFRKGRAVGVSKKKIAEKQVESKK